jgi:hypothetical protein
MSFFRTKELRLRGFYNWFWTWNIQNKGIKIWWFLQYLLNELNPSCGNTNAFEERNIRFLKIYPYLWREERWVRENKTLALVCLRERKRKRCHSQNFECVRERKWK